MDAVADAPGATPDAAVDASPADANDPTAIVWPNADSQAASDPWIVEHHDEIEVMRPRILALNFVNAKTNAEMMTDLDRIVAAIREGTRYHGSTDDQARPFLEPEVAYAIDLRDETPPADWPYRNSTLYPRENPADGFWSFDYEALFTEEFAAHYGVEDPGQPGRHLTLCELSDRGLVHEVWVYGDADVPDVSAAEILSITPYYDEDGNRLEMPMNRCAANGCFDQEDEIPAACTRTLRIGWVNNTRGPGCYMESLGHGIEGLARGDTRPYLKPYFEELGGFDLDTRYGLPFDSWYTCPYSGTCLSYPTATSVAYDTGTNAGTIDPYDPVCGNVHFPPNGSRHYDVSNSAEVMSTCRDYRRGSGPNSEDVAALVSASNWAEYQDLAPDCMGAFVVWWWQSFPGRQSGATDDRGEPMKNWWPFLYY